MCLGLSDLTMGVCFVRLVSKPDGADKLFPDPNGHFDDIVEYAADTFGSTGLQARNIEGHLMTIELFPPSLQWRRVECQSSGSCGPSQGCPPRSRRDRHTAPGATTVVFGGYCRGRATHGPLRGRRAYLWLCLGASYFLWLVRQTSQLILVYILKCLFTMPIPGWRQ